MVLKNRMLPVVTGLVFVLILGAGAALAAVPANFATVSAPKVTVEVTDVSTADAGTVVSGEITRSRFSSRSPVSGQVTVEVFSADGRSLGQTSGQVSPHFVGRSLRPSTFAVQLDTGVPAGGHAVVSFGK